MVRVAMAGTASNQSSSSTVENTAIEFAIIDDNLPAKGISSRGRIKGNSSLIENQTSKYEHAQCNRLSA